MSRGHGDQIFENNTRKKKFRLSVLLLYLYI